MKKSGVLSPRIRVAVFGLPELLRTVVTNALADDPHIQVSDSLEDARGLVKFARQHQLDAIVTIAERKGVADADIHAEILEHSPRTRIFCLAPDGGTSWKCELRLCTIGLGDISPEDLVAMIHQSARQPLTVSTTPLPQSVS